jgi:hypothetical protein
MKTASGYHEVDQAYERSYGEYVRNREPEPRPVPVGRQCGCSQNFTVRRRCVDCPVVAR